MAKKQIITSLLEPSTDCVWEDTSTGNPVLKTFSSNGWLTLNGGTDLILPLSIANGGTGSTTKSFVDLISTQTINGVKTFTNGLVTDTITRTDGGSVYVGSTWSQVFYGYNSTPVLSCDPDGFTLYDSHGTMGLIHNYTSTTLNSINNIPLLVGNGSNTTLYDGAGSALISSYPITSEDNLGTDFSTFGTKYFNLYDNKVTLNQNLLFADSKGIIGVTDASVATAGNVGEYLTASITAAHKITFNGSTSIPIHVISLVLTPGDWNVLGNIGVLNPSSNTGYILSDLLTSSDKEPDSNNPLVTCTPLIAVPDSQLTSSLPSRQINVSVNTTVYLSVSVTVSSLITDMGVYGIINARRIR